MAITEEMQTRIDSLREIRKDDTIKATPRSCSGDPAQFSVTFPSFEGAFTTVKFATRSSKLTVLTMRETPQGTAINSVAMIRLRVDEGDPADELAALLDTAYNTEPGV